MLAEKLTSFLYLPMFVLSILLAILAPRTLAFSVPVLGLLPLLIFSTSAEGRKSIVEYIIRYKKFAFLLGAIIGLASFSLVWTVSFEESYERILKTLPILVFGFFMPLVWNKMGGEEARLLYVALLAVFFLGLFFIAEELIFHMPYYRYFKGYNATEWFHPSFLNRQTVFLSLTLFLIYPAIFYVRSLPFRWFFKIGLPFILLGVLFLTESQGCQLALLTGLLVYLIFPYQRSSAWFFLKFILVLCVWGAPWIAFAGFEFLAEYMKNYEWTQNGYAAERFEIWNFISHRILENPLYGFGIEATRVMEFDTAKLYHPDSTILHPHNAILQLWIEFGALGAAFISLFVWIVLGAVQRIEARWMQRAILSYIMATLVIAATGYGLWQGWWLGLLFIGASMIALMCKLFDTQRVE